MYVLNTVYIYLMFNIQTYSLLHSVISPSVFLRIAIPIMHWFSQYIPNIKVPHLVSSYASICQCQIMSNQCHAAETGLTRCNRNSSVRPMCRSKNITQTRSKHPMCLEARQNKNKFIMKSNLMWTHSSRIAGSIDQQMIFLHLNWPSVGLSRPWWRWF